MEATVHSIVYALSCILNNMLLQVDAGDIDYDTNVRITLEDDKLEVQKGNRDIIIKTHIA